MFRILGNLCAGFLKPFTLDPIGFYGDCNTVDDLVNAAIDHTEKAVEVAEELLELWHLEWRGRTEDSSYWRHLRDYERYKDKILEIRGRS